MGGVERNKSNMQNFAFTLVLISWSSMFPHAKVCHLPFYVSDHVLLLVDVVPWSSPISKGRIFRFEQWWPEEHDFHLFVHYLWTYYVVSLRLNKHSFPQILESLHRWAKYHCPNFEVHIQKLNKENSSAINSSDFC